MFSLLDLLYKHNSTNGVFYKIATILKIINMRSCGYIYFLSKPECFNERPIFLIDLQVRVKVRVHSEN